MRDLINHLVRFNSKERFYLIGQALGNKNFSLSQDFCQTIDSKIGVTVPSNSFVAMDYHLDWIYASLTLSKATDGNLIFSNSEKIIKAQQEDIDFLVCFKSDAIFHMILIEAKGVTVWGNKQMNSKAERLKQIFGNRGTNWKNVRPHFFIISPREPQKLDVSNWPSWMHQNGNILWLNLDVPSALVSVTRCHKNGKSNKDGEYWTIKKR